MFLKFPMPSEDQILHRTFSKRLPKAPCIDGGFFKNSSSLQMKSLEGIFIRGGMGWNAPLTPGIVEMGGKRKINQLEELTLF